MLNILIPLSIFFGVVIIILGIYYFFLFENNSSEETSKASVKFPTNSSNSNNQKEHSLKLRKGQRGCDLSLDTQFKIMDDWTRSYFHCNHHSHSTVGKMYERYVGYLKEQEGYIVEYCGIHKRHTDKGIDLICTKDDEILLIQCKHINHFSVIHQNIVDQLYGALSDYKKKNPDLRVMASVVTTASFAEDAQKEAMDLQIILKHESFNRDYPSLKCNVSISGQKHIFAPYHPNYDQVKVEPELGEFYCRYAKEGFEKGFVPAKISRRFLNSARRLACRGK